MSDQQQGPGWWLASDGRWYPPESHPAAPLATPPSPPQKSGVESFGEALSSLGCALTLVGFGVLAVIFLLVLVL
jgi:hypothetical protein